MRSHAKPWFMDWRREREEAEASAPKIERWVKWDEQWFPVTSGTIACTAPGWSAKVTLDP